MTAIQLIQNERDRQILKGYDADHDDGHNDGCLADLAAYCAASRDRSNQIVLPVWAAKYADHIDAKHGHDRRQMLVIAAALIVAEIERLQRAAPPAEEGKP